MKLKKAGLFAAGIFCALINLHSFDFGGSIGTYTKLGTPGEPKSDEFKNFSIKQEEILSLWFRHDFDTTSFIAAEADTRIRTTASNLEKSETFNTVVIPDVKLLRFNKKISAGKNQIIINAGRIHFSDLSATVLSQVADGAAISADFKRLNVKLYGHYTGLLNAQNVTILNKTASSYILDTKKSWYCAAPYVNAGAQLEFPYLFANQTVSAEFLASFATEGIEKVETDYKRMWATIGLNGFLSRNLCYLLTSTIGSECENGISNLTKLTFTFFPNFKNMAISLSGIYASGEHMGLKAFKGFTSSPAVASVKEPEYSGLVKTGINASIKPIKSIYTAVNANAVFSCPKEDFEYYGFEAGLSGNLQVLSDLNINATLTQFFAKDSSNSKATMIVSATLTF